MIEENKIEEVPVEPDTVSEPTHEQPQPEPEKPIEQAKIADTPNFKALKEAKSKIERERDEALRRIKELEEKNSVQPLNKVESSDEDFNLAPDELAEGKHLSKVAKKIKQLEEQVKSYQQQNSLASTELRLKTEMPDFDKVVSKDNIDVLRITYPEIAASLEATPDLYIKAKSAYTIIKKLNISTEDNFEQDKQTATKNINKPRPLSSIASQQGDSPLARANAFSNGLTPELKKQLYQEMLDARKNA